MVQNRSRLIELFIGNAVNVVVHRILEKAVFDFGTAELGEKYRNETLNSFEIAKRYREKINPADKVLPEAVEVREKIIRRVRAELELRISKGYSGINLGSVESEVDRVLGEMGVV